MNDRLPFERRFPGTWIDLSDQHAAFEIRTQLHMVTSAFDEATMALVLFEHAQGEEAHAPSRDEWEADSRRRAEISGMLEQQSLSDPFNRDAWERARMEVERILMREKWERGIIPRQIRHHLPFIYAKAFLAAADSIGKILMRLGERSDVPSETVTACRGFYDSFPELREVRNSVQHIEDRGRGLGRGGKPLELKPVNAGGIKADGGALILNNLNGNRYGSTMADGHFGEIEVSTASLATMRDRIEAVITSLPWKGPPEVEPR